LERPKLNLASVEGFFELSYATVEATCIELELDELELELELELWRDRELALSFGAFDVAGLLILATFMLLTVGALGLAAAAKYDFRIVSCFWGF
jgi:hypothetical protein